MKQKFAQSVTHTTKAPTGICYICNSRARVHCEVQTVTNLQIALSSGILNSRSLNAHVLYNTYINLQSFLQLTIE